MIPHDNFATSARYSPDGAVTAFVSGNSSGFAGIINTFVYNNRLQPCRMAASSTGANPTSCTNSWGNVLDLAYDFHCGAGDNGNLFAITNYRDQTRNQTFTYDQLNRLISAQNAGTDCAKKTLNPNQTEYWGNNYGYDAWGNLLAKTITKCSAEYMNYTVAANNQLQGLGYDAAGNMTKDNLNQNYTYDPENRITGAPGFSYTYDADGNRVEKSNGSAGTLYWYMTPGIVAESDLNGNLQSEYVFFNGVRIARKDFPSNAVSYYFSDHLKTTDIVTDALGNIKAESDYYPWGGELPFLANDSNHYKFTGKERDSETGLDYFGARYYSNGLGRFISADWSATPVPVPYADFSDPQTLNLYGYVRGLPTTRGDPDGHCCWDEIKSFLVGAAKEVHNWGADMAANGIDVLPPSSSFGVPKLAVPAAIGESTGLTGMGTENGAEPVIESPSNGMETAGMVTMKVAPLVLAVAGGKMVEGEPAVGGRLGSASTRAQNAAIADSLESRGFKITGGGGKLKEEYIPGPNGGTKGSNYVDVTARRDGHTVRVQTVDTKADGVTPTRSEAAAAARIRSVQKPGDHTVLIPKKRDQ